jgi:hypothetical protein
MRRLRLRRHSNGSAAGPALRAENLRLLRLNLSQVKIRERLGIGRRLVEAVAREAGTAYEKVGRGRRFIPSVREQILLAVRTGERAVDIQNRFHVSRDFIYELRCKNGDREDRRLRRGYDVVAVKRALAAGKPLKEIEDTFGIAHAVLWKLRRQDGDQEDRRRRNRRILSRAERASMIADIRDGMSQRAIAKKYHIHADRVRSVEADAVLVGCW